MKILVTGASGLLGKKVYSIARLRHEVIGTYFSNKSSDSLIRFSLSSLEEIRPFLDLHKPQVIIHTASLTDVNLAEQSAPLAKLVNGDATLALASWCEQNKARLIYISTDYVFDGETGPYDEFSTPYPVQIYGFTKFLGEMMLREHKGGAVVRVGILHGFNDQYDKTTVSTQVVKALKSGETLVLDHGRIKYPTLIDDVAEGLLQVAEEGLSGIFHLCGSEGFTRYEWGVRVADVFKLDSSSLIPDPNKERDLWPRRPMEVQLLDTLINFKHHDIESSLVLLRKQMTEAKAI